MAITTVDGLVAGFTSGRQKFPISKSALANAVVGQSMSYWRSTGFPVAGTFPTGPVSCNQNTAGALPYTLPISGNGMYLARMLFYTSNAGSIIEVHDRLAHMGVLSGIVTTAQTVGIDINALAATDNIAQRKGRSDYGTVQWWLECYVATGATAAIAVITYTDSNGSSGLQTSVAIPANFRAGAMLPIMSIGQPIRSIESVTLSASTGTAGNFGVTATVQRTELALPAINTGYLADWTYLGLPPIYDSSCLFFIGDASATTLGTLNGAITLVQG